MSENVPPQPPDESEQPPSPGEPPDVPTAAQLEPAESADASEAPAPPESPPWAPARHPIHLVVTDDLHRSRLTVLLRAFLAIPHLVWLTLWGVAVVFFVIAAWFVALVTGRVPLAIHMFVAQYVRYSTQVYAYVLIAANPFPGFDGKRAYPVDLEIELPQHQNRLTVLFRLLLVIPINIVVNIVSYFVFAGAVLAWLIALVLGRIPQGFERFLTWFIGLNARYFGYVALLTGKYPSID